MDKFEAAHLNGTLDLKKLSFAIGNQDTDEWFRFKLIH
jgi:hypothetical protein